MNNEIEILAKSLKDLVNHHALLDVAKQSFFRYLEIYQRDEPEEVAFVFPDFSLDHFVVQVQRVSWEISWPDGEFCYVDVCIPIVYKQENFGWYRALFQPSGIFWDDIWHFRTEIVQKILAFQSEGHEISGGDSHE